MKKFYQRVGIGALIALIGFSVIGCVSTTPIKFVLHPNPSSEFEILGEVTHTAQRGRRAGMIDFLAEARRQFPDADIVIDIMVDEYKVVWPFPINLLGAHQIGRTWHSFRGTAVRYRVSAD